MRYGNIGVVMVAFALGCEPIPDVVFLEADAEALEPDEQDADPPGETSIGLALPIEHRVPSTKRCPYPSCDVCKLTDGSELYCWPKCNKKTCMDCEKLGCDEATEYCCTPEKHAAPRCQRVGTLCE